MINPKSLTHPEGRYQVGPVGDTAWNIVDKQDGNYPLVIVSSKFPKAEKLALLICNTMNMDATEGVRPKK